MNYVKIKTKIVFFKLSILLLCIVSVSLIQGMRPETISHESKLKVTEDLICPIIQTMSPDDLYAIFSNSTSAQFQSLAKIFPNVATEFGRKSILNIQGNELYENKLKEDFIKISKTSTGLTLLRRLLCNIFTKSARSVKASFLPTPIIKQACKSVSVQPGEYGREYEWEDGRNYSALESTLRYTPGTKIMLPTISKEKRTVVMYECPSDVALFHELLHWLHGMENYSLYKDGKVTQYSDIINYTAIKNTEKQKNFKIFHEILLHYFERHTNKKEIRDVLINMWCKQADRINYSLGKNFNIEMEEMRTVCGIGELSENAYRSERNMPLRACYTDFFTSNEYPTEFQSIATYLRKSEYTKKLGN